MTLNKCTTFVRKHRIPALTVFALALGLLTTPVSSMQLPPQPPQDNTPREASDASSRPAAASSPDTTSPDTTSPDTTSPDTTSPDPDSAAGQTTAALQQQFRAAHDELQRLDKTLQSLTQQLDGESAQQQAAEMRDRTDQLLGAIDSAMQDAGTLDAERMHELRDRAYAYRRQTSDFARTLDNSQLQQQLEKLHAALASMTSEMDDALRRLSGQNEQRAWLGVKVFDHAGYVRVAVVKPNTPAQAVGLQAGDVIVAVDGKPVITHADLVRALQAAAMQREQFPLEIRRNGQHQEVRTELAGGYLPSDVAQNALDSARQRTETFYRGGTAGSQPEAAGDRASEAARPSTDPVPGLDRLVPPTETPSVEQDRTRDQRGVLQQQLNDARGSASANREETAQRAQEVRDAVDARLDEAAGGLQDAPSATTRRARLGVTVREDEGQLVVLQVSADTPASAAGLRQGDKIVAVNGRTVATHAALVERLQVAAEATGHASLVVQRNDRQLRINVSLGDSASATGDNSGQQ